MRFICLLSIVALLPITNFAQSDSRAMHFQSLDVFEIEYVSDPQLSPDGNKIIYVRNFKDVMEDANLSNLWMINVDGTGHMPVTTGNQRDWSPRWNQDGTEIIYLSAKDGSTQIYRRWLATGIEAKLSNLTKSPGGISLSPNGQWIAFSMFVQDEQAAPASLPDKPEGAEWADAPKYIDEMYYRADGQGYLKEGYRHIFVMSIEGGTARQITSGNFHHGGRLNWASDGKAIVFSANRHADWQFEPRNSEIYSIDVKSGEITALTTRKGPDNSPAISPSGKYIAYTGFDDRYQGYQITRLYLMNIDGSEQRVVSGTFDRDVRNVQWSNDESRIYFQYDEHGDTKLASMTLAGEVETITDRVGGLSLGRPYSGGTYDVSGNGGLAYTIVGTDHPADLAFTRSGSQPQRLTKLNADLLSFKELGEIEEIWYKSSYDQRDIQGWICKPPGFDPDKKYPLMLEIHGGPFANYGPRFSAEVQLYAAKGYVVLYTNPRGSTSYGEEFGNLIHHNYPGEDYDDLMSGVDAVIDKGYTDENQLYVTGGSGGGVLTAWIVGHTDRFRAAVVAKPVINWYSFVLNADGPGFFYKYWFPGPPWEHAEHYMKRSPISYVGNVTTPTMLLTGEEDYRTPMSETEQFYTGLKLNKVESAMVRIPGASHGIAIKPSQLIAKVEYITGWFEQFREDKS